MAPKGKRCIFRFRDVAKESSNPVLATAIILLTVQFFCLYSVLGEIATLQLQAAETASRTDNLRQKISQEEKNVKQLTAAINRLQCKAATPSCIPMATQTDETPAEDLDEPAVVVHILVATKPCEKSTVAVEDLVAALHELSMSEPQQAPLASEPRTSAGGLSDDLQAADGDHAADTPTKARKLLNISFSSKSFKALGSKLAEAFSRPLRPSQSDANDTDADHMPLISEIHSGSSPMTCKSNKFWGCFRPKVVC